MRDVLHALREVLNALETIDVPYFVVGSVAATWWGTVRATRDADLVVAIDAAEFARLEACLDRARFYWPPDAAMTAVATYRAFNIIDLDGGGKVDVFVVDPTERFNASRLSRRVRVELFGQPMWVASTEDVVLAKLRWRLESRSEQQWRDCVEIVAANDDLDTAYLRYWAEQHGTTADLDELLKR